MAIECVIKLLTLQDFGGSHLLVNKQLPKLVKLLTDRTFGVIDCLLLGLEASVLLACEYFTG